MVFMIARPAMFRGVLFCVLLIWLSGCVPTASTPQQDSTQLPNATNEQVTLVLWHGWGGTDQLVLNRLVDRFNELHPQGRVLPQAMPLATLSGDLRTAVAAGSGPHIVLLPNSWIGSLANSGILYQLDQLISTSERDVLLPSTIGGAQAPDREGTTRLYGLPISYDTLALYYNSANLLVAPETTADLINSAHGLSDPNAPRWGLALNLSVDNTIGYLYAFGGRVFDQQGQLVLGSEGQAGTEQWLDWLQTLNEDPLLYAQVGNSIAVDRNIKNGQVLITFGWAHQLPVYRSLWRDHLGVAPLPRLSETGAAPQPYVKSDVLAVNARVGTSELNAALEFLRFMIEVDAQRDLLEANLQPARQDLSLNGDESYLVAARAFRQQAEQGLPFPNSTSRTLVEDELRIMVERVLMQQNSPSDAVYEADERLREKLKLPKP
jgi:arabinogalactan oligomer/maltooligosaccharide transport system substrate-binding protein